MAEHGYSTPDDWIDTLTLSRSNLVFDDDLIGGVTPVLLDWNVGPLWHDFTTLGVDNGVQLYPLARRRRIKWNQFPDGTWSTDADGGIGSSVTGAITLQVDNDDVNLGSNFVVSTTVLLGSSFHIGLTTRYGSTGNHFQIVFLSGRARIYRVQSGSGTEIGTGSTVVAQGETHRITLWQNGNSFKVYVDLTDAEVADIASQTPEIDVSDSALSSNTRVGRFSGSDNRSRCKHFHVEPTADHVAITAYSVRNDAGEVLDTGSLATDARSFEIADADIVAPSGLGPYAWVRWHGVCTDRGDGQYGTSAFCGSMARMRDQPNEATNPPGGLRAINWASDSEEIARGIAGLGPHRFSLVSHDTVNTPGNRAIVAAAAAQVKTYYLDHASAARPRHSILLFAVGTGASVSDATVTAWIADTKPYIDCFEAFNEPSIQGFDSVPSEVQGFIDNELIPFYNLVVAESPDALVLAPCPVTAGAADAWLDAYFEYLATKGPLPNLHVSVHVYNNWDSFADLAIAFATVRARMVEHGFGDRLIFQTEAPTGQVGGFGVYTPHSTIFDPSSDFSALAFGGELVGMPMEQNHRWYDYEHGFASVPGHWLDEEGPSMTACTMSTMRAELYDKPLDSVLDFGAFSPFYSGGIWTNDDGDSVLGVRASAPGLPSIRVAVTGATTVEFVDSYGNIDELDAADGIVTMPVAKTPTWLRVPDGVTAALIEADWDVVDLAPDATVQVGTGMSTTNLSRVNDEQAPTLYNPFYHGQDFSSGTNRPWMDSSGTFPQIIGKVWESGPVNANVVAALQAGPRNDASVWLTYTVEVSPDATGVEDSGATWIEVADVDHYDPDLVFDFTSRYARTIREEYARLSSSHIIGFERQSVKAVRYIITATSPGGAMDDDISGTVFGSPLPHRNQVIHLYTFDVPEDEPPPPEGIDYDTQRVRIRAA